MTDAAARAVVRPAFLDDPALLAVLEALPDARIVGGAVRDALAGRAVADIDLATPQTPERVTEALEAAGLRAVPTGLDHGTVTAISDHRGFEVTTLRHDVETDGRHAVVRFTTDWREDAARRDFTINAMSMTRDGAVHDYFSGIGDLQGGRLRFVGDPAQRIAEDFLRVLRFFRFFARYAREEPDPQALRALADGVPGLARLSAERVWSELKRILAAPSPDHAFALMARLGVLRAVLPEIGGAEIGGVGLRALSELPPDPILRLAALAPADPDGLAARLKLSLAERDRLLALRDDALPGNATDDDIRRALADTPPDLLIGRARLAGRSDSLIGRIAAIPPPAFPLHGRDLRDAGIEPGPAMGRLLRELRAHWLASGCMQDAASLRAELARRLQR